MRDGRPFLLFGRGTEAACRPIGEADLAVFMADCLKQPRAWNAVLPIGGPGGALTPPAQGELLVELTVRSVSPAVLRVMHRACRAAGWFVPAAAAKAELPRIGHYYATESMLLWDETRGCYDAEATPTTGSETLRDFYTRVTGSDDSAETPPLTGRSLIPNLDRHPPDYPHIAWWMVNFMPR